MGQLHILWDFDGTLFDTYPAYAEIIASVVGTSTNSAEAKEKLKVSFSHAAQYYQLTAEQLADIDRLETGLFPVNTPPFAAVENVLRQAEINLLVTHKPRQGVLNTLLFYGFDRYFEEIIAADDGFPRKPDPAAYAYMHDKYRVDLVIGDRAIDMIPARSLGIKTCLFQNTASDADHHLRNYQDFQLIGLLD